MSYRFYAASNFTTQSHFGIVPDDFLLDNVECDGTEDSLFDCSHSTTDNCGSTEGAGVVCVNMTTNNTLTSPNYPDAYPDDVHKCWVQAPSHGEAVSLIFTAFDVKNLVDLLFFISIQYFNS